MYNRVVSIPQGTIKRANEVFRIDGRRLFQFHKVRLKALQCGTGALIHRTFQFHKVRLKATDALPLPYINAFQFHKVRLKEDSTL